MMLTGAIMDFFVQELCRIHFVRSSIQKEVKHPSSQIVQYLISIWIKISTYGYNEY